jgi:hypothetical protein
MQAEVAFARPVLLSHFPLQEITIYPVILDAPAHWKILKLIKCLNCIHAF